MPSPATPRRLIVLDRDGVINRDSRDFIRRPAEWVPLPGSLEAIAALTHAGFEVVIASNQSGVGRGLFTAETLAAIHDRMRQAVEAGGGRIAGIYWCPHGPDDGCECRKPRPGLLRRIEADFGVSLAGVPAVGDSRQDLDAAWQVGARALLVRTGNGLETEGRLAPGEPVEVFADLAAVARTLVREVDAR